MQQLCLKIKLKDDKELYLTNYHTLIKHNAQTFYPYSCLEINDITLNDSTKNKITIKGVFHDLGINREADLINAKFDIYNYNFENYICSEYYKYDFYFKAVLEPVSKNLNFPLLETYSASCRAKLGDTRCKINNYSITLEISKINQNIIYIKKQIDIKNDYYNKAQLLGTDFNAKIIDYNKKTIELDQTIPLNLINATQVMLLAECDKSFATCCNKFKNVINFRGEPFIFNLN